MCVSAYCGRHALVYAFRLRSLCVNGCLPRSSCVNGCLPNTLLTCQDVPGSHSAVLCRVKGHTLTSCARRRGSLGTRLLPPAKSTRHLFQRCSSPSGGGTPHSRYVASLLLPLLAYILLLFLACSYHSDSACLLSLIISRKVAFM